MYFKRVNDDYITAAKGGAPDEKFKPLVQAMLAFGSRRVSKVSKLRTRDFFRRRLALIWFHVFIA
jgi:hypothetical protein